MRPPHLLAYLLFASLTGRLLAAPAELGQKLTPFLDRHCYDCHGEGEHKGGLALDKLSLDLTAPEHLQAWVKVLDQIESGEMPPKDEPRPPAEASAAACATLRTALLAADRERQRTEGRVVARRLNRVEFENTVRDLLAIETPLKGFLPEDNSAHGFDNIGAALDTSSVLMERYLEAADTALDAATAAMAPPVSEKQRFTYQDDQGLFQALGGKTVLKLDDAVVMYSDGYMPTAVKKFRAPLAGHYRVRVSAYTYRGEKPLVMAALAGDVITGRGETHVAGYFEAPVKQPAVIEFTDHLAQNGTFKFMPFRMPVADYLIRKEGNLENYQGPGLAVQWVEIEGPLAGSWPPESRHRLYGDLPLAPADENSAKAYTRALADPSKAKYLLTQVKWGVASPQPQEDAEMLLRAFLPRAFRRPVTEAEAAPFLALTRARLEAGYPFDQALLVGYKAILTSPKFLFLRETPGPLDDYALASRLSYFLWSTMPDAELLELARQNRLHEPATLRAQTERLLASPRAAAFTEDFLGQWLDLRQIDFTTPDKRLYPEYDDLLKVAMVRETQLFFEEILKHDLPVQNFIQSDFAMLNRRLADHYGIPGIEGLTFRKVPLPAGSHRGGLLTQAALLKVTANGTTTSPVLRGKWILDRIMGIPPAPPPKAVAAIEPDIRGAKTIREQLDLHRNVEACATCHRKIDPPGFALENFDVIGGWRENYRSLGPGAQVTVNGVKVAWRQGPPVDASASLENGPAFHDVDEFKALLLRDPGQIARCLAAKLLVYGTGAGVQFADRPVLAEIVARTKAKGYGLRTLLHEVIQSPAFLSK